MEQSPAILEKLKAQRARAAEALDAVRTELDIMLVELVAEISRYLGEFVFENVLRDIRKKSAGEWPADRLDALRGEVLALVNAESGRIADTLRNSEEWYHPDMVFLEKSTQIWKTVRSIDPPVNKLLKKYGLGPVKLRNWAWLGEHLDMLANDRYPPAKREFNELQREIKYLDARIRDEDRAAGLFPAPDRA